MTLSLRTRQVATVTALVVCSLAVLATVNLASLLRISLCYSHTAEMIDQLVDALAKIQA